MNDIDLGNSFYLSYPIQKFADSGLALRGMYLRDRRGIKICLVSNRTLPPAHDRLRRHGPVQKHDGADHDRARHEEPKKDL
jgi:hypothetical protein